MQNNRTITWPLAGLLVGFAAPFQHELPRTPFEHIAYLLPNLLWGFVCAAGCAFFAWIRRNRPTNDISDNRYLALRLLAVVTVVAKFMFPGGLLALLFAVSFGRLVYDED